MLQKKRESNLEMKALRQGADPIEKIGSQQKTPLFIFPTDINYGNAVKLKIFSVFRNPIKN